MQAENKKNNIYAMSFGCRLNALESEKIQKMLQSIVDTAIVINTCAVTGEAERQSGQAVRRISRENHNIPIFVTGCATTRNPELFDRIPNALVIHNRDKMNPNAYTDAIANAPCNFDTPKIVKFNHPVPRMSKQYIQVQNGCNHSCTYCVTRLLRGKSTSVPYDKILGDARCAVQNGFGEIILTGVDTASYANDGMLISDVCSGLLRDVPEIKRLRISSFDPASPQVFKIIDLIHSEPRMMPHMHLSMQSGSDTILRAMGRRHTSETVRKITEYAGPNVTFSWDIICGFPGETDALFCETLNLVRQTRPIKIHAFPFSPRPGTVAADMPNQINRNISKARVHEITALADAIRTEFMNTHIGQCVPVLVEENNIARTPHDIPVKINGLRIAPKTICDTELTGILDDMFVANIR